MRQKIGLLGALLALFTPPLMAQEEIGDEEGTQTSVLLMPNAFSPNGDGINDIYKPKEGYQNIKEFHAYIYNRWDRSSLSGTTLPRDGMAPTRESRSRRESISVSSRQKEQMARPIRLKEMSTCSEDSQNPQAAIKKKTIACR